MYCQFWVYHCLVFGITQAYEMGEIKGIENKGGKCVCERVIAGFKWKRNEIWHTDLLTDWYVNENLDNNFDLLRKMNDMLMKKWLQLDIAIRNTLKRSEKN